jgi:hypothetical protein
MNVLKRQVACRTRRPKERLNKQTRSREASARRARCALLHAVPTVHCSNINQDQGVRPECRYGPCLEQCGSIRCLLSLFLKSEQLHGRLVQKWNEELQVLLPFAEAAEGHCWISKIALLIVYTLAYIACEEPTRFREVQVVSILASLSGNATSVQVACIQKWYNCAGSRTSSERTSGQEDSPCPNLLQSTRTPRSLGGCSAGEMPSLLVGR